MEQLTLPEYQERKRRIKDRLNQTVENFIVIGYELRQIRDTEAFRMDGYSNLADFAKAEFNLSRDTVSRFISINIKLTVDGDGVELLPELKGLGYSKLQDVLQLPADDYQLLTPQTTVKEIRDLKKFNHGDATYERMAVPLQETALTPLRRCIKDFFSAPGHRSMLNGIIQDTERPDYGEAYERKIAEEMNPTGTRTHQKGLIYLFLYDYSRGVSYKQMGRPQPETMSWHDFIEEIRGTFAGLTDEKGETWSNAFGQAPEETEIPGQMSLKDVESAMSQQKEQKRPNKDESAMHKEPATKATEQEAQKKEKAVKKPEKRTIPDPKAGMDVQELEFLKAAVDQVVQMIPALMHLDNYSDRTVANILLQEEIKSDFIRDEKVYRVEVTRTAVMIKQANIGYAWGIEYFASEVGMFVLNILEKQDEEREKSLKQTAEEVTPKEIPAENIRELPAGEETMVTEESMAPQEAPMAAVADQHNTGMEAAARDEDLTAAAVDPDSTKEDNSTELWKEANLAENKLHLLFGDWSLHNIKTDTLQTIRKNALTIAANIEQIIKAREKSDE